SRDTSPRTRAREPAHPFAEDSRRRHALRAVSSTQKAVEALARDELVGRDRGRVWITEPFLAERIRAHVQCPARGSVPRDDGPELPRGGPDRRRPGAPEQRG